MGANRMETRITGAFQNSYRIDTTIRNPDNKVVPVARVVTDGAYVGPC